MATDDPKKTLVHARAPPPTGWMIIPVAVAAVALGLPVVVGASADACKIVALFCSASLAFAAVVDEEAIHSLFFPVVGSKRGWGFPMWMLAMHWIIGLLVLYALLCICDPRWPAESKSVEVMMTFIGLTYIDLIFGVASAGRRLAQGQQADLGLYITAAGPAIVYAVLIACAVARLDASFLPIIAATDVAVIFAVPMLHVSLLRPRILSMIPSLMGNTSDTDKKSEGSKDETTKTKDKVGADSKQPFVSLPCVSYVALTIVLGWLVPPLTFAAVLSQAPLQMLSKWRTLKWWVVPSPAGLDDTRTSSEMVGQVAAVILLMLLVFGSRTLWQGLKQTTVFLNSLARSEKHSRIDAYDKMQDDSQSTVEDRNADYAGLVDAYYDLATEFYEWGWGTSFHFADRRQGESFRQSILRHEYYIGGRLGVSKGAKVLDCGCGIGGPARNIARFTGANITAVTINQFQVDRGNTLSKKEGIRDQVELVQGDFMKLPFPDASFDAVYAIESTCHAPDREGVYGEILRVLKPGGTFATYEWCLTDFYNPESEHDRKVKKDVEVGDGLPDLVHTSVCTKALGDVGFDVLEARDCALDGHLGGGEPWYMPLVASWKPWAWPRFQFNPVMFVLMPLILRFGEFVRLLPAGTSKTQVMLQAGGVGCAAGGANGIFTPMWLMVARKPA